MTQQECKDGIVDSSHEDEYNGIEGPKTNLVSGQKKLRFTEADINCTSNKLHVALEKKARAEKLLAEMEKEEIPQEPEIDKEGITEEERYMLRKVGLRMKPFLLLGRRGVFDGTVENMHLHWKYRELVKVVCGGRPIEEVKGIAQTLETESGGILVTVERISKGFAIIVALFEAQRHKSLKLHVLNLTRDVDELKLQLAKDKETNRPAKRGNFQLARERSGVDSSSFNSNDGIDASMDGPETNKQAMLRDFPLLGQDKVDEFDITEPDPLSDSECEENSLRIGSNGLGVDAQSATCPDDHGSQGSCYSPAVDAELHVGDEEAITPVESPKSGAHIPVHSPVENLSSGVPFRAVRLSNRERLLLRKQALKMKKRPVLAVGRSNIVTGVAKTIKTHFQKHPLAIVNVKGRAKGTSVQEVVSKLEEATGAVLVSQEINNVILYRGWGAEREPGQTVEWNNVPDSMKTSVGRKVGVRPVISPELMDAIRLECYPNASYYVWSGSVSLESNRIAAMRSLQASTSYGIGISSVVTPPQPRLRHRRVVLAKVEPSDKSGVTSVVIKGLADHKDALGAPLCPCRHYDDKAAEAGQGFWNCPCVPMRERKECHCMLFLTPDNDFAGQEQAITLDEIKESTANMK
ncbi:hypothetical protein Vadar_031279 [Vaccinium darrowii]|uniref:Uncharacterized protein n=1 Tax=Vaccinium darrowii TaxID=229202 RepID=A0ACB7Y4N2_9ERIC|nr:hypothetical protein Vadar_031279 [Vaccinium darrowii]